MSTQSIALSPLTRLPTVEELGFDPDALRDQYRTERDKRLHADGNAQYQEVVGDFSHYIDDPYAEALQPRAALNDEVDVIIVGGGFGGLICGARLREAGVERIRIIEKASDVGGTWYWNRYPGAACDTEAYIYLPLCEELGYVPRSKYAFAPEIFEHARRLARHYRLYDDICLQTQVQGMDWDDTNQRWCIRTDRGDAMHARFVIMSNGPLNRPKLPGIAGIRDFRGHTFHTSRWDYNYTGGSPDGGLHKLADKRVGIIGTGAPPCSACRTSAPAHSRCTFSNVRRHPWTCATTASLIPPGRQVCIPDGSVNVWKTSTR